MKIMKSGKIQRCGALKSFKSLKTFIRIYENTWKDITPMLTHSFSSSLFVQLIY